MYYNRNVICLSHKRIKIEKVSLGIDKTAGEIFEKSCPGGETGRRTTLRW